MTIEFSDPVEAQTIEPLMAVRRAFPVSQQLLAGAVLREEAAAASVGWHNTDVCAEMGAVAVVPTEGDLSGLVGDIVVVKNATPLLTRGVYVYVIGSDPRIIDDISIGRRAFLDLAPLSTESLVCSVGVIA